jgi:nitric oxide reductase NorD protein
VLSDGIPYDEGYEGHYASADAKRALAEAREAGVGCLCLSLGGALGSGELESVFGTAAFARADGIDDLGPRLNGLFNAALFAAERAQRRRLGSASTRRRSVG